MEGIIAKSETSSKSNFKSKTQVQPPKIVLGAGRSMAEIDYDAVFGNEIKK